MSFDREVAVRTIWGEARGETEAGQYAVAHVLKNRLKAGRWSDTLAGVCLWPLQFSTWNVSDPNRKLLAALPDTHPQLVRIHAILGAVLSGEHPDNTGGATHYHAAHVFPDWAPKLQLTATIGHHLFYRAKSKRPA